MSCTSDNCNNPVNVNPVTVRKVLNPVDVTGNVGINGPITVDSINNPVKVDVLNFEKPVNVLGPNYSRDFYSFSTSKSAHEFVILKIQLPSDSHKRVRMHKILVTLSEGKQAYIFMQKNLQLPSLTYTPIDYQTFPQGYSLTGAITPTPDLSYVSHDTNELGAFYNFSFFQTETFIGNGPEEFDFDFMGGISIDYVNDLQIIIYNHYEDFNEAPINAQITIIWSEE